MLRCVSQILGEAAAAGRGVLLALSLSQVRVTVCCVCLPCVFLSDLLRVVLTASLPAHTTYTHITHTPHTQYTHTTQDYLYNLRVPQPVGGDVVLTNTRRGDALRDPVTALVHTPSNETW